MPINFGTRRTLLGAVGETYIQKVLGIQAANLILYHPMNEPSGGVAIDASPEGNDGAYTGVTLGQPGIGDGETCPYFDGTNDYNDIYSAGLNGDYDGAEVTIAAWLKVVDLPFWGDNTTHRVITIEVSATNSLRIEKSANVDDRLSWVLTGGSTTVAIAKTGMTELDWIHVAITVSENDDKMIAYYNGVQEGAIQTGLGTWAGALLNSRCVVGAQNNAPGGVWDGWLAHPAIWKVALTPAEILQLATL